MPGARALVQGRHEVGLGPGELGVQHLGEEMVIAEPLPGLIKRHDEKVLPLKDIDDLRRVGRPGYGVAQRRAEPGENRRPHKELPDIARLAAEYLLGQEMDDGNYREYLVAGIFSVNMGGTAQGTAIGLAVDLS